MRAISIAPIDPWAVSAVLHGLAGFTVLSIFLWAAQPRPKPVEITIIEIPKASPKVVTLSKHKPVPLVKARQVYGVSRKALTSENGAEVKAGNTLAKTPDTEQLKPSDLDSLPVPSEEYLVTAMPKLLEEVRIPYPPGAKVRGVSGVVTMDLLIDNDGKVRQALLVDGPDYELSAAAVAAATGFRFKPAYIQDKPVAVKIRYAYRFVIER